jgi:hypothetical protein
MVRSMKPYRILTIVSALSIAASGCGQREPAVNIARQPASIRGWIHEIELPPTDFYKLREASTGAREARMEIFRETSVIVDEYEFASGGVAEYGSFIILDVPPGDITLNFTAPHVNDVKLPLRGIPPNADVVIGGLMLTTQGARLADPSLVQVRVPRDAKQRTPETVSIAGVDIPVQAVPLGELGDRREWPTPQPIR